MSNKKHGYCGTPTHSSWKHMRRRCNDPKSHNYKHYGGRGISYDPRWEDFNEFLKDMGERPKGMTLDRIRVNESYSKNNCKWSTKSEQSRNQRPRIPGIRWVENDKSRAGGFWRVRKVHKGNRVDLYCGPDYEVAVDALDFYNSFILGIENA